MAIAGLLPLLDGMLDGVLCSEYVFFIVLWLCYILKQ